MRPASTARARSQALGASSLVQMRWWSASSASSSSRQRRRSLAASAASACEGHVQACLGWEVGRCVCVCVCARRGGSSTQHTTIPWWVSLHEVDLKVDLLAGKCNFPAAAHLSAVCHCLSMSKKSGWPGAQPAEQRTCLASSRHRISSCMRRFSSSKRASLRGEGGSGGGRGTSGAGGASTSWPSASPATRNRTCGPAL